MAAQLRIGGVSRTYRNGEIWQESFNSGLNLIVGPQNTSKTTTLRIVDFCLGDKRQPASKFATSIVREYESFEVPIEINGKQFSLKRSLQQKGSLTLTEVDGQTLDWESFNAWILNELGWPQIRIPKGLDATTSVEEVQLSFRTLFRHVFRRADSWTSWASKEHEHQRRAAFAFLLGVAEDLYAIQSRQVAIARSEVESSLLEERKRELISTFDEITSQLTKGLDANFQVSISTIPKVMQLLDDMKAELNFRRANLMQIVRTQPGYQSLLDTELANLVDLRGDLQDRISEESEILDEHQLMVQVLEGDIAKVERAVASRHAFKSMVVKTCPACFQAIKAISEHEVLSSTCYVCHQKVTGDAQDRRLELEERSIRSEILELTEVISERTQLLEALSNQDSELENRQQAVLRRIEAQRQQFVSPLLAEFEDIQFRLGEIEQQQQTLTRLQALQTKVEQIQTQVREVESRIETNRRQAASITQDSNRIWHRLGLFADAMNEFISLLPLDAGIGGPISIDPNGFQFYVGREPWDRGLGDERSVVFLTAYQYAFLRLSVENDIPYPRLVILDNPFQQDVRSHVVERGLEIMGELCSASEDLQVIVTTRRQLESLQAHRVPLNREYNPDDRS
jgi:uncharacterized protein YydD (DUF2326 family)